MPKCVAVCCLLYETQHCIWWWQYLQCNRYRFSDSTRQYVMMLFLPHLFVLSAGRGIVQHSGDIKPHIAFSKSVF